MGSISPFLLEENSRIETRPKKSQKMGSISPCSYKEIVRWKPCNRKMGSFLPTLLQEKLVFEMLQKILAETWEHFPLLV